jgi:hypothetical protein
LVRWPLADRFWAKVDKSGECWEWRGALQTKGYGVIRIDGRLQLTHRVSHDLEVGPVEGLNVLHRCDNPKCVRPSHLFLGTQADNMTDKASKGRASKKLTAEDVRYIKAATGVPYKDLAWLFHVDPTLISQIMRGKIWRHVEQ